MQIPVLIEKVGDNGYRARDGFGFSAEGETKETARDNLRLLLERDLPADSELQTINLGKPAGWRAMAGIFKDDPLFDPWQESIAENRRKQDANPDF